MMNHFQTLFSISTCAATARFFRGVLLLLGAALVALEAATLLGTLSTGIKC